MHETRNAAEPDLTPLLDMVLQIVMFFLLVANSTMQELDDDVRLPLSSQAQPVSTRMRSILYLNIDSQGRMRAPDGEGPKITTAEMRTYLRGEFRSRAADDEAHGRSELNTLVVIRADQAADYAAVFDVLREVRHAGFTRWTLRAQMHREE